MADNVTLPGTGSVIAADEAIDGTLGTVQFQIIKLADGTLGSTNKAVVSSDGALKVDNSAVTQPVSGTFWQTTQPVSAASLPLPSGASTSAKQPALGAAGSASSDVITVQGIASMTALKVDGSAVTQPVSVSSVPTHAVTQSGTWTVQPGNTANTTAWKVDGSAVTQPVSGTFWQATQPVSGTVSATLTSTTNAGATAKSSDYDTGAGTDTVTMFGIALPASGGAVQGGTATNPIQVSLANTASNSTAVKVDASGTTVPVSGTFWQSTQPVSGTVTVQQSTASSLKVDLSGTAANATAIKVDGSAATQPVSQSGTWTVQPGNTANSTPWLIQNVTGTSGGWSVSSQTALTSTKVAVKASAGQFGGYMLYNPNASAVYIQVFDVASGSVTLGTTTPTYVISLPASAAANVEFTMGITHSTAITLAATTTATGSTGPGTSLTGFFLYK